MVLHALSLGLHALHLAHERLSFLIGAPIHCSQQSCNERVQHCPRSTSMSCSCISLVCPAGCDIRHSILCIRCVTESTRSLVHSHTHSLTDVELPARSHDQCATRTPRAHHAVRMCMDLLAVERQWRQLWRSYEFCDAVTPYHRCHHHHHHRHDHHRHHRLL
jgi:hypothetical protein